MISKDRVTQFNMYVSKRTYLLSDHELMILEKNIDSLESLINNAIMDMSCVEDIKMKTHKSKEKFVLGIQHSKIRNAPEKRGDGSTFIRYKARPNGCKNYISSQTYEGLIDKLYDHYARKNLTLADVFPEALRWKAARNISAKTIVEYKRIWDQYIKESHIACLVVDKIDVDVLAEFYDGICMECHMTYKRLQDIRNVMSFILKYCVTHHMIKHNPAVDVDYTDFPYAQEPRCKDKIKKAAFPVERLQDIVKWCIKELDRPRINPLHALGIIVGVLLACRYGELRGLKWSIVDFINKLLLVEDQVVPTYQFNRDDLSSTYLGHQPAGHIKGYDTPGAVPIPKPALDALKRIKALELDDVYVFPSGHFRHGTFNATIKRMAADLGLDANKYSSHSLRATAATYVYLKTYDIYLVQRLLHHSSPNMTMKYIKDLSIDKKMCEIMLADDFFDFDVNNENNYENEE